MSKSLVDTTSTEAENLQPITGSSDDNKNGSAIINNSTEVIAESTAAFDSTKLISSSDKDNPYYFDYSPYYRWLVLIFFFSLALFAGPAFFNWPPLKDIFKQENVYTYLCDDKSDKSYKVEDGFIYCAAKDKAIGAMFTAAVAVMFTFDIVAGVLLDCFGGKVACLFGITAQLVGWILLALSSEKFYGYLIGLIFMAAGQDPLFFGLISVSNLFPGWEATIVAILGAARSLSYVIFMVLERVVRLPSISLTVAAMGFAILLFGYAVLIFFFVPFQSYPKLPTGVKLHTKESPDKTTYSEYLKQPPEYGLTSMKLKLKDQFNGVVKYAFTLPFMLFCTMPFLTLLRNNYYTVSYEEHLSNVKQAYTILNPLSFIPCPIVGIIADRVSTIVVIIALAVCGALSMAAVTIPGVAFEIISVFFNFFFSSFCISQFYCYAGYVYPQKEVGKLIGIGLLVGGLLALLATPMYDFAVHQKQFLAMDLLVVVMEFVVIAIAIFLYFKVERPIRQKAADDLLKCKTQIETTATEAESANTEKQSIC